MTDHVRFWINEREYLAPRDWIVAAMNKGKEAGLSATDALVQSLEQWVKERGERCGI